MNYLFGLILTLITLFTPYTAYADETQEFSIIENKATVSHLSPELQNRKTLKIKLTNGLQAYIVSDSNLHQSGAALTVDVGSFQDPKEHPGMAHFLEHMLFMGTKKFPKESEYQRFIAQHGGMTNAFTMNDSTSYLFTVDNDAFNEALDRFSSFFKHPLFNPSGVSRELQAIDQEYAKNLDNDQIRELFVHKDLANPNHPYHNFNMGNSSSLSNVSQEELKKWYHDHYSSNLMHLIIFSPLDLDKLKQLVVSDFSEILNKNKKAFNTDIEPFLKTVAANKIYIEPIKNTRTVTLVWDIPQKFTKMKGRDPDKVICHILGHEGKESLLAELKRENLAEGLKCGDINQGANLYQLFVEIELTKQGLNDVDTVIERVFQTIARMKQQEIPEYLFDELNTMSKIRYQYLESENDFLNLMKHAIWIKDEPLKTFPEKTFITTDFDPNAVLDFLSYMTPDRVRIDIMAPKNQLDVPLNKRENWLGIDYATKPIPQMTIQKWSSVKPHESIDIPSVNPFIPKFLSLEKQQPQKESLLYPHPELIFFDQKLGKIYFAQDTKYLVPKVSWIIEIKTPLIDAEDPRKVVLADLYVKLLNETLNETGYLAKAAQLEYEINKSDNGIKFEIKGYSDNAKLLLEDILNQIQNTPSSQVKFEEIKESLQRKYQNFSKDSSLKHAAEVMKDVLYKDFTTNRQKERAIRNINKKQFEKFSSELFNKAYFEAMLYGNMTRENATEVINLLFSSLNSDPYPKDKQLNQEIAILPEYQGPYFLDIRRKVPGNAVMLAIESPFFTFENRAAQQIMMQAIKQPFFETLRTKQQTGYIVLSDEQDLERKLFQIFAVQSNTHEPRDLLARFEEFIESYLQEIEKTELNENEFNNIKDSLLVLLKQSPKNLNEMGERLFKFAFEFEGDFNWIEKRIEGFEALSYKEFVEKCQNFLGKNNKRRLAILLKGEIPDQNLFRYKRAKSRRFIRSMSQYEGG